MNGGFRAALQAIRSSYWFIPSIMALLAILLGALMIWVDVRLGSRWISGLSWYQQIRADGAREVLSTIAGSMVTVAGVVFSITIVALSYASSQYGPRVLTNFMSDRGNTITLGTFIATFLYCLMVLRTIRGGDDDFVPQYAVIVAMLLAVCSIGVLIYFIHHVPQSIHINNVVGHIGEQLVRGARKRFPDMIGSGSASAARGQTPEERGPSVTAPAAATGYIQSIDDEQLLSIASKADVLIRLRYRPGDFVMDGRGIAEVAPSGHWNDECTGKLQDCFTVGNKRTPEHDLMFLVSELVEIAARALSPGVNDPMTAITCLDWLGAGGSEFAIREMPEPVRHDGDGKPRLVAEADSFAFYVDRAFGRLRQYAAADVIAALHWIRVVGELAATCRTPDQIDVLCRQSALFRDQAAASLEGPNSLEVSRRALALQALLERGAGAIDSAQIDWLGGSS
ncbi:DUF2254 domain-containing protein [Sphingomonas sp. LHG3406-1]|uniref:DUF2254 domain-containing protein n=1 Tax=Sphingomonas sp. LHG3406-1 TaxID=2804617 RepID=UPI00261A14DB|nr:DUF2254 domain-containing protein [Sphingomonas sp. LHG3406-1]